MSFSPSILRGETNSKRRAEREKREALAKLKDKIQEIEAYSKQLDPVKQKHTRVRSRDQGTRRKSGHHVSLRQEG